MGSTFSISNRGLRIAERTIHKYPPSFSLRLLVVFSLQLVSVVRAQNSEQQPPIQSKLPSVRCAVVPTQDAVQWNQGTPVSVTTEKRSTEQIELRVSDSTNQSIPNPEPQGPKIDLDIASGKSKAETPKTEHQTLDGKRLTVPAGSVSPYPAPSPNAERQTPNGDCGTDDIQSAIRNSKLTTDAWFQISADTPELSDVQEVALTSSDNNNAQIGPQSLAQVLANLARRAQRNFVDPGIPANETITYNFTESDLDPWETFTRIAEARGYRLVYSGDVVTLARSQQDPLDQVTAHMVKAEVWVWVDNSGKVDPERAGLAIQSATGSVVPNIKPLTVRSLEPGRKVEISLIDSRTEQGENALRLTINPVLLPNGNIEAGMGIENATPSSGGRKAITIRRTAQQTVEFTPTKQVIEIGGILVASDNPHAGKQSWIRRLFRKNNPEKLPARMVVRLTVESMTGSGTPIHTENPVRSPGSNSDKTGLVLAPGKDRRVPELTSIQTVKRGGP